TTAEIGPFSPISREAERGARRRRAVGHAAPELLSRAHPVVRGARLAFFSGRVRQECRSAALFAGGHPPEMELSRRKTGLRAPDVQVEPRASRARRAKRA